MSLAERLQNGPPKKTRYCHVCVLLSTLPEEEAAALRGMLESPQWTDAATFRVMQEENLPRLPTTDQFIGRHRRECA